MDNKSSHKSKFYNKRAFKVSISLVLIFSIFISSFIFSASAYNADFPDKVIIQRHVTGENSRGSWYSNVSKDFLNVTYFAPKLYNSIDINPDGKWGIYKDTFGYTVTDKITIRNDSDLILITNPNKLIKISLLNVNSGFYAYLPEGTKFIPVNSVYSVLVNYSDGTHKYYNSTTYISRVTQGQWNNFYLTFKPDYHILSIEITVKCIIGNVYPENNVNVAFFYSNYNRPVQFYYDYVDEVVEDDLTFFEKILNWISNLYNSIVDGFNSVLDFITGVWNFVFVNLADTIVDAGGYFINLVRSIIDFGNIGGSS